MPPLTVNQVLAEEYKFLHPGEEIAGEDVLEAHQRADHSALCLSGGGVRSAAFGLGVLQWLARAGVLGKFDYLSTVSGGGYIGSWLSAWRLRAGAASPFAQMQDAVEPAIIARLRDLIKYLDPHTGSMSADVWTLGATVLRNLLVTWLVLVPLIAFGAMVPQTYLGLLLAHPSAWWYQNDWGPILLLVFGATTYAAFQLPSLGHRARGATSFIVCFLVPLLAAHLLLSLHRFWSWIDPKVDQPGWAGVAVSVAAMALPWMIGGWFSRRWWRPWTWAAAALSGFAGRLMADRVHGFLIDEARMHPRRYAVVDMTLSELMLFVQLAVFIGLASRDMTDEDREWWARASAWILLAGAVWMVASTVTIVGPVWIELAIRKLEISRALANSGLSVLTAAAGAGAYWSATKQALGDSGWRALRSYLLPLLAPLMVVLLMVLAANADLSLVTHLHGSLVARHAPGWLATLFPEDLIVLGVLLLLAVVLGRVISVNEFSLHDMYRARLIRTFLGVSRSDAERHPSRFTGFDVDDDLPIAELERAGRPLHVINATLNLVDDGKLSMAETKATSFTTSALHAGSRGTRDKALGYRPSAEYAGGVSLGRAMATSGAAVSPSMGASSSPTMTFLLTVLNARLGVWLGNPGSPGERAWRSAAPAIGVSTLVDDLLGRTTDTNPYVYLSDGGHFENLGLYEMVARRCRYIIVSDAGADPLYQFDDLANAIRRVHIDFGIVIEFKQGVRIGPPGTGHARWALGRIRYDVKDDRQDGLLVYMKPAILGDEQIDVTNYARTHPAFPQESTADQWFDEAQFDSYRELGFKTAASLSDLDPLEGHTFESVRHLFLALREAREGREEVGAV